MVRVGGHFHGENPLDDAVAAKARTAQFFLGDPQGWKGPVIPGDPEEIKAAYAEADVDVYIHAPYVINVASTNNRIRIPSRKLLDSHLKAAASIGAKGLIVHGGHVTGKDDPAAGVDNWVKAIERSERPLPLLIENTAGGDHAMARKLDALARLWEAVSEAAGTSGGNLGFCLDTCHANSAGIDLADAVDAVKAITGRIDLVHCNNSRDKFGSGADRHANFETGTIDRETLAAVVRAAGAPVVCETPLDGLAGDIAWLTGQL
ncbi:MAG: deoxyribonuclease IV [Streptosporangiales bacterium]|nr:deoxyribonuclease IV [Streptosporangiales bacterium]